MSTGAKDLFGDHELRDPMLDRVPFPDLPIPSCVNCGFLYRRGPNAGHLPSEYYPATPELRMAGAVASQHEGITVDCWRNAADLDGESRAEREAHPALSHSAAEHAVTARARACSDFFPFRNGRGPVEHQEDLRMMQFEEDRRRWNEEFSERVAKRDQEFFERLATRDQEFYEKLHKDSDEASKHYNRWSLVVAVVAIIVTVTSEAGVLVYDLISKLTSRW